MRKGLITTFTFLFLANAQAAMTAPQSGMSVDIHKKSALTKTLSATFMKAAMNAKEVEQLQKEVRSHSGKAVPALIDVMKSSKYPDKNRWVATFLLGQIMGKKSSPFIVKFLKHPSWVMRMAALKTLLALKETKYAELYSESLTDESLIVRGQALENIRQLNLKSEAPYVWAMLYDKKNYYKAKPKKQSGEVTHKRTHLIKDVIRTVGDLDFNKAQEPLFKMIQKERYNDIFDDMDYALSQILDKKSPDGPQNIKRRFWKRTALAYTEF
jgi:hypothetical protein